MLPLFFSAVDNLELLIVCVEAADSWGNTAIGEAEVNVTNCAGWSLYLPLTAKP